MDEPLFMCAECDKVFYVVWCNDGSGEEPGYCPFCGEEVDYGDGDGICDGA